MVIVKVQEHRHAGTSDLIILTKARPVTEPKSENGKSPLPLVEGLQSCKAGAYTGRAKDWSQ